jgi:hypothetical protein
MSEPIPTPRDDGGFMQPKRTYRGRTFYPLDLDNIPTACHCGQPLRSYGVAIGQDAAYGFAAVNQADLTAYLNGHQPAHDIVVEDDEEPALVGGDCRGEGLWKLRLDTGPEIVYNGLG